MIHVLMLDGECLAAAWRWEALSERMADYPADEQAAMRIEAVGVIE